MQSHLSDSSHVQRNVMSLFPPAQLRSGQGLDVLTSAFSGRISRRVFISQNINEWRKHATFFQCRDVFGSETCRFCLPDLRIPA